MLVHLLEKFNSEQFDSLAVNLQGILYGHFRRIGQFHKALITRAPVQDYDYEENDSHRVCNFGQWQHSQAAPEIKQNKDFIELGNIHEELHTAMRDLLRKAGKDGPVTAADYDIFLRTYIIFTDKLTALINDINFAQYQFDPLTRLLNRRAFRKILEYEFSLLRRKKRRCTVAMADIDHFKNINDEYGHPGGDTVLKSLADLFLEQLRAYDTVGRHGGEEFIFCLPGTALVSAKRIMERLRKKVERTGIPLIDGKVIHVTLSIGVGELKAKSGIDETLRHVDEALYKAKESGRNRVEASALL